MGSFLTPTPRVIPRLHLPQKLSKGCESFWSAPENSGNVWIPGRCHACFVQYLLISNFQHRLPIVILYACSRYYCRGYAARLFRRTPSS